MVLEVPRTSIGFVLIVENLMALYLVRAVRASLPFDALEDSPELITIFICSVDSSVPEFFLPSTKHRSDIWLQTLAVVSSLGFKMRE